MITKNKICERFLKYVRVDSQSNWNSNDKPSSVGQTNMLNTIHEDLKSIGITDVKFHNKCFLVGTIASNVDKRVPTIAFFTHVDVAPGLPADNVKTRLIKNYNGEDIKFEKDEKLVLSTDNNDGLKKAVGCDIITTDGRTLLGGDDKAGCASLITAAEYLINNPDIKHGEIKLCFTADEEIGKSPDYVNVDALLADYAYTIDCGGYGNIEYETFTAYGFEIKVNGANIHPGYAKNKMINSIKIVSDIIAQLPKKETPEKTSNREGFIHVDSINGSVDFTSVVGLVRDFDNDIALSRVKVLEDICKEVEKKYPGSQIDCVIQKQYENMKYGIEKRFEVVEYAIEAMERIGVRHNIDIVRGGTDGARLTEKGLPSPNIFYGGGNLHSRDEWVCLDWMVKSSEVVVEIMKIWAEKF